MRYSGPVLERPNDSRAFVHKRILGAASGFLKGGFGGAAAGFLTSGASNVPGPRAPTTTALQRTPGVVGAVQRFLPGGATGFRQIEIQSRAPIPPQPRQTGLPAPIMFGQSSVPSAPQTKAQVAKFMAQQLCCPGGQHANKADYWVKERDDLGNFTGNWFFVEAGSRCVTNRRRNPLNPRALSRAMARTGSAVAIVDRLLPAATRRATRKRTRSRKRARR